MKALWTRLAAVPTALWLALAAAVSIVVLVLRGRRLEAELGAAKLSLESAKAHATLNVGKLAATRHMQVALRHASRISELEEARKVLHLAGEKEGARLAALPADKIFEEYDALALRKRKAREQNPEEKP